MNRTILTLLVFSLFLALQGQEDRLPADLRQHNLTTYNASLFNPAFSMDRNNPESVALWVRWQWQGIDSDPTTLFLNYTRKINDRSAAGAAFFQQNTGIFFNTGAALNYAHQFNFNSGVKLAVGVNLFGFQQKLADDRFQVDPNFPLPMATDTNDFIVQMAPGVSLSLQRLTLSLASENLLDYNFTAKESNTEKEDKIFMSLLSYDFPVTLGSATNAFLRPSMYLRTIPGQSNQVGFYTLLNTNAYWAQLGYNNFYGYGIGGGATFFKRLSIGALVEIGTGASIVSESSFELMAAYFLGTPGERHKMVGSDNDDGEKDELLQLEEEQEDIEQDQGEDSKEKLEKEEAVAAEKQAKQKKKEAEKQKKEEEKRRKEEEKRQRKLTKTKQDSIAKAKKAEAKEGETKEQETIAEARRIEEARKDSIDTAKQAEARALKAEQQRKIDSTAQAKAAVIRASKKKSEAEAIEKQKTEEEKQQQKQLEKEAAERAKEEKALAEEKEKEQKRKEREERKSRGKEKATEEEAAAAEAQRMEQKRKTDSINDAKQAEAEAIKAEQQRKIDSTAKARADAIHAAREKVEKEEKVEEQQTPQQKEADKPKAGEKYQEVQTEEGLKPGYYLIANVFGTKKYLDAFIADLRSKGMQPKFFQRGAKNYNYAYLERFDTMSQARRARDNNYDGKYPGKTWIFRVVSE